MNTAIRSNKHNSHRAYHPQLNARKKGSYLGRIKSSFNHATGAVSDKTSDLVWNARSKSRRLQKNVNRFVSKKPYKAMGLTMLTGLCIGYFLRQR